MASGYAALTESKKDMVWFLVKMLIREALLVQHNANYLS